ncbi:MAG: hypothetical protein WC703_03060 [Candidatus Neomarinimicrobiota bacterium]
MALFIYKNARYERAVLLRLVSCHLGKACRKIEVQLPAIAGISSLLVALDESSIKERLKYTIIFI